MEWQGGFIINMNVETRNFGLIEIKKEQIIHFPEGLPGFNSEKRYVLLPLRDSEFLVMQSIDKKELAFMIVPSPVVTNNYEFEIDNNIEKTLGVKSRKELAIFNIVNTSEMTVNLKAPVIINNSLNTGIQVILEEEEYPLKHKIAVKDSENEKVMG